MKSEADGLKIPGSSRVSVEKITEVCGIGTEEAYNILVRCNHDEQRAIERVLSGAADEEWNEVSTTRRKRKGGVGGSGGGSGTATAATSAGEPGWRGGERRPRGGGGAGGRSDRRDHKGSGGAQDRETRGVHGSRRKESSDGGPGRAWNGATPEGSAGKNVEDGGWDMPDPIVSSTSDGPGWDTSDAAGKDSATWDNTNHDSGWNNAESSWKPPPEPKKEIAKPSNAQEMPPEGIAVRNGAPASSGLPRSSQEPVSYAAAVAAGSKKRVAQSVATKTGPAPEQVLSPTPSVQSPLAMSARSQDQTEAKEPETVPAQKSSWDPVSTSSTTSTFPSGLGVSDSLSLQFGSFSLGTEAAEPSSWDPVSAVDSRGEARKANGTDGIAVEGLSGTTEEKRASQSALGPASSETVTANKPGATGINTTGTAYGYPSHEHTQQVPLTAQYPQLYGYGGVNSAYVYSGVRDPQAELRISQGSHNGQLESTPGLEQSQGLSYRDAKYAGQPSTARPTLIDQGGSIGMTATTAGVSSSVEVEKTAGLASVSQDVMGGHYMMPPGYGNPYAMYGYPPRVYGTPTGIPQQHYSPYANPNTGYPSYGRGQSAGKYSGRAGSSYVPQHPSLAENTKDAYSGSGYPVQVHSRPVDSSTSKPQSAGQTSVPGGMQQSEYAAWAQRQQAARPDPSQNRQGYPPPQAGQYQYYPHGYY